MSGKRLQRRQWSRHRRVGRRWGPPCLVQQDVGPRVQPSYGPGRRGGRGGRRLLRDVDHPPARYHSRRHDGVHMGRRRELLGRRRARRLKRRGARVLNATAGCPAEYTYQDGWSKPVAHVWGSRYTEGVRCPVSSRAGVCEV